MKFVPTAFNLHLARPLASASLLLLVALSSLACDGASDADADKASADQAAAAPAEPAKAEPAKAAKADAEKTSATTTLADLDKVEEKAAEEEKGAEEKADAPKTDTAKAESTDEIELRRLVLASKIEEREPVALDDAKTEDPVTAFVELVNPGASDDGVVVTFEHESGTKVGFIELGVPADSQRYRTWGRTRNIKKPGTWEAIVTTRAGRELARQSFEISG